MQSQARTMTLVDAVIPGAGVLRDALLVVGFSLFTAVFAQIAIRIPTTTVPITGQTFAVLVAGAALGSRRGALSMLLYALLGMFALPVFAPPASALANETFHFVLPWEGTKALIWDLSSGGYIVGFVLASYLTGRLAEHAWDRRPRVMVAMLLGNIVLYGFGLVWLASFIASDRMVPGLGKTYYEVISGSNILDKTLRGGLYPFIGGDALKLLLASMVLPGAWELVRRFKGPALGSPKGKS